MSVRINRLSSFYPSNAQVNTGATIPNVGKQKINAPELNPASKTSEQREVSFQRAKSFVPVGKPFGVNYPGIAQPIKFIDKYVDAEVISNAIKTNPEITKILASKGLKPVISNKNIDKSLKRHLFTTYIAAMEIVDQLGIADSIRRYKNIYSEKENREYLEQLGIEPPLRELFIKELAEEKSKLNIDEHIIEKIAKAALVHDIGKALIPESIIQKRDTLTPEEKEIIDLHSTLGGEILKTTDIDPAIIEATMQHHDISNEETTKISDIVAVADVYSALKEERPYKTPMTDEQTFQIMFEDMPKLNKRYIRALYLNRHK